MYHLKNTMLIFVTVLSICVVSVTSNEETSTIVIAQNTTTVVPDEHHDKSSNHLKINSMNASSINNHGHPLVPQQNNNSHKHQVQKIHLANWNWEEYGKILTIVLTLIIAGIIKLGFHHTPGLPNYIPESCVLIIIGICMGAIIYARKELGIEKNGEDEEYFHRVKVE